jgi:hypothetical protein
MENINLALILLGAFWTGTSAIFTGIKDTGALRDTIVTGKAGESPLPIAYLRHLFWVEWLPLKLSLAAISVVLAVIIVRLPQMADKLSEEFQAVCYIAAALPLIGAAFQILACCLDGVFMWRRIGSR